MGKYCSLLCYSNRETPLGISRYKMWCLLIPSIDACDQWVRNGRLHCPGAGCCRRWCSCHWSFPVELWCWPWRGWCTCSLGGSSADQPVLQADSFKDHSLLSNQNHLGFSENKTQTLAKDVYVLFSLVYLTTALYREPCVENAYSCFFSLILRCVQGISFLFVPLISHFLCEIISTTYDASVLCACPYWCFFGLKCWILSLQDSVQLPWTLVEVNRRKIGFTRAGLTLWVGKSVH